MITWCLEHESPIDISQTDDPMECENVKALTHDEYMEYLFKGNPCRGKLIEREPDYYKEAWEQLDENL